MDVFSTRRKVLGTGACVEDFTDVEDGFPPHHFIARLEPGTRLLGSLRAVFQISPGKK